MSFIRNICCDQLEIKARELIEYANGVGAEEFLNIFENEIQRAISLNRDSSNTSKSWSNSADKVSKDANLLLLKNCSKDFENYSQVISTLQSNSIAEKERFLSQLENIQQMRTAIQIFLLLRSTVKRLKFLFGNNSNFTMKQANDLKRNADDLFTSMTDEYLNALAPATFSGEVTLNEGLNI